MNLVKIYFFFCFFFVIGSHDAALRNFISKIVSKYRFVEKSDLEFSEWPISISGGYVLSFQIDGFRFLGSSLSSNNLVFEWMVFPASDVIPLKDFVTLSPEGFWWNPETHEILRYVETGGEGGYVISTLLSEEGISSQAFDVSHEEVTNGMGGSVPPKKGFYFFRPVVSIATLYDLLNHGTKAWKRFSLAEDGSNYSLPEGKLLLSADADRRNDFSNFTPEIALALLSRMPAPPPHNAEGHSDFKVDPSVDKSTDTKQVPHGSPKGFQTTGVLNVFILSTLGFSILLLFFFWYRFFR